MLLCRLSARDPCAENTGHVTYDQFNDAIGEYIQPRPTEGIMLKEHPPTPRLAAWVEPMFLQKSLTTAQLGPHQLGDFFDLMDPYASGTEP